MRSTLATSTPQLSWRRWTYTTANQHQAQQPWKHLRQNTSSTSRRRNMHSSDEQSASYNGWHTPDLTSATQQKELARSLQQPTTADQQKLKHLLRYIKGTKHYKQIIRPTVKIPPRSLPDLNIYVDSDWAGCKTTRKSTTGFVITFLGATINYGSMATRIGSSRKSKAHWPETFVYTTIDSARLCAADQNTHQRQPGRHIHQVCLHRDSATSPATSWNHFPATQPSLRYRYKQFHQQRATTSICSVQRARYIHLRCRIWAMGSTMNDQHPFLPFAYYNVKYFNKIYHTVWHVPPQHDELYMIEVVRVLLYNMSVIYNIIVSVVSTDFLEFNRLTFSLCNFLWLSTFCWQPGDMVALYDNRAAWGHDWPNNGWVERLRRRHPRAELWQAHFVHEPNSSCSNTDLPSHRDARGDQQPKWRDIDVSGSQQDETASTNQQQHDQPVSTGLSSGHNFKLKQDAHFVWQQMKEHQSNTGWSPQRTTARVCCQQWRQSSAGATISHGPTTTHSQHFSTSLISTSLDNHWTCFMQALEYSGSSTMSRINAEEANRLWAQINKPENWRDAQNIPNGRIQNIGTTEGQQSCDWMGQRHDSWPTTVPSSRSTTSTGATLSLRTWQTVEPMMLHHATSLTRSTWIWSRGETATSQGEWNPERTEMSATWSTSTECGHRWGSCTTVFGQHLRWQQVYKQNKPFVPESVWAQGSSNSVGLYLILSSSHLLIFTSSHLHIFSSSHLLIFTSSHYSSSHLHIFSSSHLLIFTSSHPHIFSSSHLHIFLSSHPLIFTSSRLHTFSSSHPSHLLIFTSSHFSSSHLHILHIFSSSHLHIFSSSHLLIFTSAHLHIFFSCPLVLLPSCPLALFFTSFHPHIFTSSSHPHIFTSSHLHIFSSFPLALLPSPSFLFLFWRRGQGQCQRDGTKRNPFARNEVRSSKNWSKSASSSRPAQPFRTKLGSIAKNWSKSASSNRPAQPFRTKWGSIAKNWSKSASSSRPAQPFRTKWGSIAKNWSKSASSSRPAQPFRTKWGSIAKNWGKIAICSLCTKLLCAVCQSFCV